MLGISAIASSLSITNPLGSAGFPAAVRNSSETVSSQTIPTDTFDAGIYNAAAYAGLYSPPAASGGNAFAFIRVPGGSNSGNEDAAGYQPLGEEDSDAEAASGERAAGGDALTEDERAQVEELKTTDREVRQHEQAHMSVGGAYAGAASYSYERGPDGQNYAVGGEVSIDVSAEDEAEATIAKMRIVHAAALAPANPSSQDMSVAAQAQKQELEAQQELRQQQTEELQGGGEEPSPGLGGMQQSESGAAASKSVTAAGIAGRNARQALSAYYTPYAATSSRRSIDLVA